MADRVRVWCLRHGESENVAAGVAGAVPWSALTVVGRRQAVDAAHRLADEPIVRIYSSSALRARQTAAGLASRRRLDVVAMDELAEVGIGEFDGSRDPAILGLTAKVLRAWIVEGDLEQRVRDGESGRQVVARMTGSFRRIAADHGGETVAVVGHVASLTVTLARLCDLRARVWGTPLPHAEPFLVEWNGTAWRCLSWPVPLRP
ncbi:histidine phosphatase family protein [Nocardia sp. NPDC049526]|uniref:histidine phosphatase family protein n=1 Tax=Nocardia sp. NPDC049526 TaxID=3364316 RepID=UPI00379606E8